MPRPAASKTQDTFRDAISQWQLAARTEVKKSSALPSSMFDACDPMLEARLAESVEHMMQCLHDPVGLRAARERAAEAEAIAGVATEDVGKRTERVTVEELQQLPATIEHSPIRININDGLAAECLGLLVDACTTGDARCQQAARTMLRKDFDIDATRGLDEVTEALQGWLPQLLGSATDDDTVAARIAELCGAIAASVVASTPTADDAITGDAQDAEDKAT
ncbi:MAG: hypothetical protein AB8H80_22750 [Planctomycetota bacterium]